MIIAGGGIVHPRAPSHRYNMKHSTKTLDILTDIARLTPEARNQLSLCTPWGGNPGVTLCTRAEAAELERAGFVAVGTGESGWDCTVWARTRRGMQAARFAQALSAGERCTRFSDRGTVPLRGDYEISTLAVQS